MRQPLALHRSPPRKRESTNMQQKHMFECFSVRSKVTCFAVVILIGIINIEMYQLGWYNININQLFRLPKSLFFTSAKRTIFAESDEEQPFVPFRKTKINARMIDEFVKRENFLSATRNYSVQLWEARKTASRKLADMMLAEGVVQKVDELQQDTATRAAKSQKKKKNSKSELAVRKGKLTTVMPTTLRSIDLSEEENKTETRIVAAKLLERANDAFLVNEADRCNGEKLQYFVETVVIVTSKAENIDRRIAARNTWLSEHWRTRLRVTHLFLLGLPATTDRDLERRVAAESSAYQDMLLSSEFVDSYANLARKSLAMLKWVAFFCANAKFLVKADDDTFVNLARLVPILRQVALPDTGTKSDDTANSNVRQGTNDEHADGSLRDEEEYKLLSGEPLHSEAFVLGGLFYGGTPHRDPISKWYVPESEYPANEYPPFAFGIGYAMSVDAVQRLFVASLRDVTPFRLEDVYITGILAERAKVQRIAQAGFFNYLYEPLELCAYNQNVITSHYVSPRHLDELWRQIIAHETENYRPDCGPLV